MGGGLQLGQQHAWKWHGRAGREKRAAWGDLGSRKVQASLAKGGGAIPGPHPCRSEWSAIMTAAADFLGGWEEAAEERWVSRCAPEWVSPGPSASRAFSRLGGDVRGVLPSPAPLPPHSVWASKLGVISVLGIVASGDASRVRTGIPFGPPSAGRRKARGALSTCSPLCLLAGSRRRGNGGLRADKRAAPASPSSWFFLENRILGLARFLL